MFSIHDKYNMDISQSEKIEKLSEIGHITHRPDMYIGAKTIVKRPMTVVTENGNVVVKEIKYCPAIVKIIDEIVSNAIDHKLRVDLSTGIDQNNDPVRILAFNFDYETGAIKIANSGRGIVIEKDESGTYVPQTVYTELRKSSNFDDTKPRFTGGRNGYGAALTTYFSEYLEVLTVYKGKKYHQKMNDHGKDIQEPIITDTNEIQRTTVHFKPDYKYFEEDDHKKYGELLFTRACEISAVFNDNALKVTFNGKMVPLSTYDNFLNKLTGGCPMVYYEYIPASTELKAKTWKSEIVIPNVTGWRVGFWCDGKKVVQQSFVNGINTFQGGQHVNTFLKAIIKKMTKFLPKNITIGTNSTFTVDAVIKKISIYLVCFAPNPGFTGQTKEVLDTRILLPAIPDELVEEFVKKTSIIDVLKSDVKQMENRPSNLTEGKKLLDIFLPKLDDADDAGKKSGCSLIISEGGSSGGAFKKGRYSANLGSKTIGVFQLKGKIMNPRKSDLNTELCDTVLSQFKKAMGLDIRKNYNDGIKDLRYSSLIIGADQDADGFHITGLILNYIHLHWPELLAKPGFVKIFKSKYIKFTSSNEKFTKDFYSQAEYNEWKKGEGLTIDGKLKFYKGIGNNSNAEMQDYFKSIKDSTISVTFNPEKDNKLFEEAFGKDTNLRKEWILRNFTYEERSLDKSSISAGDYIDEYVRTFSNENILRNIPYIGDGLKETQRKIFETCLREPVKKELKVLSLVGKILSDMDYNHGDASLEGAIVNMAQNFTGRAFINLLCPIGQFGSYVDPSPSASRYIATRASRIGRALVRNTKDISDETVFPYKYNEGHKLEPKVYYPCVPLVLLNGAKAVGTGWSTCIYKYSFKSVFNYLVSRIRDSMAPEELPDLSLEFYKHLGKIDPITDSLGRQTGFYVSGKWELEGNVLYITELPPYVTLDDYKQHITKLQLQKVIKEKQHDVLDSAEQTRYTRFYFSLTLSDSYLNNVKLNQERGSALDESELDEVIPRKTGERQSTKKITDEIKLKYDIVKDFLLRVKYSLKNMFLIDKNGKLKRYCTAKEIMEDYIEVTMEFYEKLYKYKTDCFENDLAYLISKLTFVKGVALDKKILIFKRTYEEISVDIEKYSSLIIKKNGTYTYLTDMSIRVLTIQKIDEIQNLIDKLDEEYNTHKSMTPKKYWLNDMKHFVTELQTQLSIDELKKN